MSTIRCGKNKQLCTFLRHSYIMNHYFNLQFKALTNAEIYNLNYMVCTVYTHFQDTHELRMFFFILRNSWNFLVYYMRFVAAPNINDKFPSVGTTGDTDICTTGLQY